MADTRIFRLTRADGTTEYTNRRGASARLAGGGKWTTGRIVVFEATNAEATAGWTDVTPEFLGDK